jgi:NADH:ubiquinone oxidoreductase subunit D
MTPNPTAPNTGLFLAANAERKEEMMNDAMQYITVRMLQLKTNIRIYKQWVKAYPDMHKLDKASLIDPARMVKEINRFSKQMDELTAECVHIAAATNDMAKYLLSLNTKQS